MDIDLPDPVLGVAIIQIETLPLNAAIEAG
jgi:hypothetical protein